MCCVNLFCFLSLAIRFKSVALGKADDIKPSPPDSFAVARAGEGAVDEVPPGFFFR